MANALYDKGRQKFAEGSIAWLTDTIRIRLVSSAYTPNLALHEFLSDIPAGARIGSASSALTGKTTTNGVCDADDVVFPSVASGSTVSYVIGYKDTGVEGTSPLIFFIDTATGLPLTTTGADVTVQWDNGANRIFKL
jgi:hypothetical protein